MSLLASSPRDADRADREESVLADPSEEENRRAASSLIRTALIQYCRHTREILLKLFLLDVGWIRQPHHGVVEKLLQEIAAMDQQKQRIPQDALMSQWQLNQQIPPLLPPAPLIDAAVDVLATGMYRRLPLLLPLQLLGKASETKGEEEESAMDEVRRRVADALLLRLHFSPIPKKEVYIHLEKDAHVHISLPHEVRVTAVSDLTTLQALAARLTILEGNGFGTDAVAAASLGVTNPGGSPPLGVNATLLFLLRSRLASVAERLQLQESEAELLRWQAQVRENAARQLENLEAEKGLLLSVVDVKRSDASPEPYSPFSVPASTALAADATEDEELAAALASFASPGRAVLPPAASQPAAVDAFFAVWTTARRVSGCTEMDLLRDQALRLLRVSSAASLSASRLSCTSPKAPRRLLLSHVTYRALATHVSRSGELDVPLSLSLPPAGTPHAGSTARAEVLPRGSAGGETEDATGDSREETVATQRAHVLRLAAGAESEEEADEDMRLWRERERENGEEERFFVPLATAAAVAADAEADWETDATDAAGGDGEKDAGREGKKTVVLLQLQILGGFDVACADLRNKCLQALMKTPGGGAASAPALGDAQPRNNAAVREADGETRDSGAETGNGRGEGQNGEGERRGAESSAAVQVSSGPSGGAEPSGGRTVGSVVGKETAAMPVSLAFVLCSSTWRVSVTLWPLHPMMDLFERSFHSSFSCGSLCEADAFALSVVSQQACWRALSTWQPSMMLLEDWVFCASQCLSLLQLLTLAYHLRFPLLSFRPAAPSADAPSGRGLGEVDAARVEDEQTRQRTDPAREGEQMRAELEDKGLVSLCKAAAPDSLDFLVDSHSIPVSPFSPLPPSPATSSLSPCGVSPSTCLLRLFYYGQPCELSIDATTGAGQFRCPWLPRRLQHLLLSVPRSLRDLLQLLPLVRRAAFHLLLGDAAVALGKDRFDLLPAPPELTAWTVAAPVAVDVHAHLRAQERAPGLLKQRNAAGDGAGAGDQASEGGENDWTARLGEGERQAPSPTQSLGGVLASEAAEALEKLLHLRAYELASTPTPTPRPIGVPKPKKRGRDAETPRDAGEAARDLEEAEPGLAGRNREGEAREAGREGGSPTFLSATFRTSTAFFRIRVSDEESDALVSSSRLTSDAFLVASVLFDDDVVGCSYLLFPAAREPVSAPVATAFADALGVLFAEERPGNRASLAPKQRGLFASVRLHHLPFRLTLREDERGEQGGKSVRSSQGEDERKPLLRISVKNYLHAIRTLLKRHAGLLRQLSGLSLLLPLALPCAAKADVLLELQRDDQEGRFASPSTVEGEAPSSPLAAVAALPDLSTVASGPSTRCDAHNDCAREKSGATPRERRGACGSRCLYLQPFLVSRISPESSSGPGDGSSDSPDGVRTIQEQMGEEARGGQNDSPRHQPEDPEEESLLLECTVDKDASEALAGQPRGGRALLSFLFSPPLCEGRSAFVFRDSARDTSRGSSVPRLPISVSAFNAFYLLVTARRLAFVCRPETAQASEVILPLSDFLKSLPSDAGHGESSSFPCPASLFASRCSTGARAEAVVENRAELEGSREDDGRTRAGARRRGDGGEREREFCSPAVKLLWRVRESETGTEGRDSERETRGEGAAEPLGEDAPDRGDRRPLSRPPSEVDIECTCQIRHVQTCTNRRVGGLAASPGDRPEPGEREVKPGGDDGRNGEPQAHADDRHSLPPPADDLSSLVTMQCSDLRAVCTLPSDADARGLSHEKTRASPASPVASLSPVASFARTLGRCVAAFLRLEMYIHLHSDLLFLQRHAYGKSLEIRACFPGALIFFLRTPSRRRTRDWRSDASLSRVAFSPFLGHRTAPHPDRVSDLAAETEDAYETLKCTIALASLAPHLSAACVSSDSSERPDSLSLPTCAPNSPGGPAATPPAPVSRRPLFPHLFPGVSSLAPRSSLSPAFASAFSLSGAPLGAASLLAFDVEASSPELSWLFSRQVEAGRALLPRQLGTALQLLSSSAEMLASYLSLHACLLLMRPVRRRTPFTAHFRQLQQKRVVAFRKTDLFSALLQPHDGEKRQKEGEAALAGTAETPTDVAPTSELSGSPHGGAPAAGKSREESTSGDSKERAGNAPVHMAFSDVCDSPEKSIRALSDAAAAAGLELTHVYIQAITPARATQTPAARGSGESAAFSPGHKSTALSSLPLSEPSLSGEETAALEEDSTLASASLPALLLRVPGLPPVLLRLDPACRCCLRLYIVLQETRERPLERGSSSREETPRCAAHAPRAPPGEAAGEPRQADAGEPSAYIRGHAVARGGPPGRTEQARAATGSGAAGAKTVQYVDMDAAASVALLASLDEAVKSEKREEREMLSRIHHAASFQVLLLASFAAALKHFASAACVAIRVDQGEQKEGTFKVKREKGAGEEASGTGTAERETRAKAPRRGLLAPAVSSFFLLGASSSPSDSKRSSSLLAELPRLFLGPGTCLKLSCASPLLGGTHSLCTTAPVASLFFFPGLLLPQVLLPLLQFCRVFAVYSTAKVALNPAAILSSSGSPPALADASAALSAPVTVESVVLSAASVAQKLPSSEAKADAPGPPPREEKDEGNDSALTLWVSYTDFATRARCVFPRWARSSLSTGPDAREGRNADPSGAAVKVEGEGEDGCAGLFSGGLLSDPQEKWKFVRPKLFNLPWPLLANGGAATLSQGPQREQSQEDSKESEKEKIPRRTPCTEIAWSSATTQALLAPWGSALVSQRPSVSAETQDEIPPLLPRLHTDPDGCVRVVLPFFQLRLGPVSPAGSKDSERHRSLSVLKSFMCYVAPCLPLNNIPTFIAHLLQSLALRARQKEPSPSASFPSSARDALQESAAWLLQPLRSLAAHLAFHSALISLRRERQQEREEKGKTGEKGEKNEMGEPQTRGGAPLPSFPPLPSSACGEDDCITYQVVYVTGCPEEGAKKETFKEASAPWTGARGRSDETQGRDAPRVEDSDARLREEWLYRCYYPSLSESLNADPSFVRFCCLVEELHEGLFQYYRLYRNKYLRMRTVLGNVFAYLDARNWRVDIHRNPELRALVVEKKADLASRPARARSNTASLPSSASDAGHGEGEGDSGDRGKETSSHGVGNGARPHGAPETPSLKESKREGCSLAEIETPPTGIPLLVPLPKLPFIECRFLPQQAPDSLCMEFALHRLLPLHHCRFYSLLHFLHLLPPRLEISSLLPPALPPPPTHPVLLLQPRVKVPPSDSRASSALPSPEDTPQPQEVSQGRGSVSSSLASSASSTVSGAERRAGESATEGKGEEATDDASKDRDLLKSREAVAGAEAPPNRLAQRTPSPHTALSPFSVYRCFTAALKVHPFPPPHVSLIHVQGIKLPALLQELQRHERLVSTAVLKPQMERASRNFHLAISYSLAACASLFFGAVDFDGLARALQKLVSQHQAADAREAPGKLGQAQLHAPLPSSVTASQTARPAGPAASSSEKLLQPDVPSTLAPPASCNADAVPRHSQRPASRASGASPSLVEHPQSFGRVASPAHPAGGPRSGSPCASASPQQREGHGEHGGRTGLAGDAGTPPKTFAGGFVPRTVPATGASHASQDVSPTRHVPVRVAESRGAPAGHSEGVGGPRAHAPQTVAAHARSVSPLAAERAFPNQRPQEAQGRRSSDVDLLQRGTQARHFGSALAPRGMESDLRRGMPAEASATQMEGGLQDVRRCLSSPPAERDKAAGLGFSGVHMGCPGGGDAVRGLQKAGIGSPLRGSVSGAPHGVPAQRQQMPLRPNAESHAYDGRVNGEVPADGGGAAQGGRRVAECSVGACQETGLVAVHQTLRGMRPAVQPQPEASRHAMYVHDPSQGAYRQAGAVASQSHPQGGQVAMAHAGVRGAAAPQELQMGVKGVSEPHIVHGQELSIGQTRQAAPPLQGQPQEAFGANLQLTKEGYAFGAERPDIGRLARYSGAGEGGREQAPRGSSVQQTEAFHGAHGFAHGNHPHQAAASHFHLLQHQGSQQVGRSLSGQMPQHASPHGSGGARPACVITRQTPPGMPQLGPGDNREASLQARPERVQQQASHQHALHLQQQLSYGVATRGMAGAEGVGTPASPSGVAGVHAQRDANAWRSGGDARVHGAQQIQSPPRSTYPTHANNPEDAQQQQSRTLGADTSSYGVYSNGGQGYPVGSHEVGGTNRFLHQATAAHGQQHVRGVHAQPHLHMQHSRQFEHGMSRQVLHSGVSEGGAGYGGMPPAQVQQERVSVHSTAASRSSHPVCRQRELYQQGNPETGTGGYGYQMQQQAHAMLQQQQNATQPGHAHRDPHQHMHPSGRGGQGW
ncbi:conserved hypothetical protein [Neospora caninum Liverpool]|uniref:Mediator of RNA polymerase II transcription subunit 14 n=1 Tax=Neospora caninum (strain Liverpool) TaxID=572307 RepID=F0VHM5_NEOCL|nr:conserved hypothetical protein [Neospora caninum Liverpool]CBZ53236.1 conserved hypothetical protein [Neospora caninum Liverpool]CEL67226.1 TPA: mediator complex subunit MED14 [Neospora caninum Liverpool]|eukprot:XP_003883268.1 conserved hypothetical protein [Neospora caninum Liverpool]